LGANVLVEFKNVFLIGGIFFYNWGQLGTNMHVEFENIVLIGGIFFTIGGIYFHFWGQKIILGLRKPAILGIIWTPVFL